MISNTCRYAIRALIYLAINEPAQKKIGIKQISSDLFIPQPFLSKILQQLAKHKILYSGRGPTGGFELAKPANSICLMDIIRIIDGNDFFETCLIGLGHCSDNEECVHCPIHDEFAPIRIQLRTMFENKTIGQLAEEIIESQGAKRI